MQIFPILGFCLISLFLASCDTRRTDTNAESIVTEDTPLDATGAPIPPPPTGTDPASDRGPGTGPGTGAVETGTFDGGDMIETDTIRAGAPQTGVTGSGGRAGTEERTGAGSRR
jgi:hypothetical protein